jgi:hypothetical protein
MHEAERETKDAMETPGNLRCQESRMTAQESHRHQAEAVQERGHEDYSCRGHRGRLSRSSGHATIYSGC